MILHLTQILCEMSSDCYWSHSSFPLFRCTISYCAIRINTPLTLYTPHSLQRGIKPLITCTMATAPTWAQVAKKKKPPPFLPMVCAVDLEQFTALQRLPPSSSCYSAFIPLPTGYKQGWALDIVTNIPSSAVGLVPRADISLIEVCFANKEVQQLFLSSPFVCKHFTVQPVPPAGTPSIFVPIKLMNIPILASLIVDNNSENSGQCTVKW